MKRLLIATVLMMVVLAVVAAPAFAYLDQGSGYAATTAPTVAVPHAGILGVATAQGTAAQVAMFRGRGMHIATVPVSHGGTSVIIALLLAVVIGDRRLCPRHLLGARPPPSPPSRRACPPSSPTPIRGTRLPSRCCLEMGQVRGPSLSKAGRCDHNDREGPLAEVMTSAVGRRGPGDGARRSSMPDRPSRRLSDATSSDDRANTWRTRPGVCRRLDHTGRPLASRLGAAGRGGAERYLIGR